VQRSRDAGFDHHCGKPINVDAVVSLVATFGRASAI
jgi:hypothetical protein